MSAFSADRIAWLKEAFLGLSHMEGYGSSLTLAPSMLSGIVLRSDPTNAVIETTPTCCILHKSKLFSNGKRTKVVAHIIPRQGYGKQEVYLAALDILSRGGTVSSLSFHDVAVALGKVVKKGSVTSYSKDFVATDLTFDLYAGGRWKSVRRSLRKGYATKVLPLAEAANEVQRLDAAWLAHCERVEKPLDSDLLSWEGDKVSALNWWAQNYEVLESCGMGTVAVGSFDAEGCYSVQLFCRFTKSAFFCFARRHIHERSTAHAVYEEMRIAGEQECFRGLALNDGEGLHNSRSTLNRMKSWYCELRAKSYTITP